MRLRTKTSVLAPIFCLLSLTMVSVAANGQEEPSTGIHWAYSAYFGTGWYSVGPDRDVFVFRVTPGWQLQETSIDAVDFDNVAFLSANPGVDIEIPVNRIWWLRPYASLGYGTALNGSESAPSYWAGVKSRVTLHSGPRSAFAQ